MIKGTRTGNALQVLILTPHIHTHLKQHDPKALEQAIEALRYTLPEEEREDFEERLSHVQSEGSKTKDWVARFHIYLPKPHWSLTTLDGQTILQVLMEGPATPYLSRS
jgi:hypothetical protein